MKGFRIQKSIGGTFRLGDQVEPGKVEAGTLEGLSRLTKYISHIGRRQDWCEGWVHSLHLISVPFNMW